ncbi:MAG: HAMP domain-containing histidine kinase, partial [Gemmataceae bacterium]|nr:HAMP domain-containing histidine kinase [Gemmataceae bacterium]
MSAPLDTPEPAGSLERSATPLGSARNAPTPSLGRFLLRLMPLMVLWLSTAGLLVWLLYSRAQWNEVADEANIREWVENTRIFRKTLTELAFEYVELHRAGEGASGDDDPALDVRRRNKRNELFEHMRAMVEPLRLHATQLPLFPEVARLEVRFDGPAAWRSGPEPIRWQSPKLFMPAAARPLWHTLTIVPATSAQLEVYPVIQVDYRLHTYNRVQLQQEEYRWWQSIAAAVLLVSTLLAFYQTGRFWRQERRLERERWQQTMAAEQRERELLQARIAHAEMERQVLQAQLKQQEAERAGQELRRRMLEQQLEAARLEQRAAEAERRAFELRSQLYASIGILAGSYAHNIKNLLVRPNDLLARCLDASSLADEHKQMLQEVRATLGTVTERLQQILRTVRRDPTQTAMARVNLASLLQDTEHTWRDTARDKWKVELHLHLPEHPLWVRGDLSHLQQAIENLLFNARDATFEMRNYLRLEARKDDDPVRRRQRLLAAASWKGHVHLRLFRQGDEAILEVADNGIGMTEEVRSQCLRTYFSTKRDNALYEGYSSGMGLGLSFVAMVMEHHGGRIDIESVPLRGSVFRLLLPLEPASTCNTPPSASGSPPPTDVPSA